MPWAKLHTDILGDVKLMRAARKGAKGLELFPWLIAFAKEANDGGRLTVAGEPADARDIADLIPGVNPRAVQSCFTSCLAIGVLARDADGALRLTAWEHRSGAKPSDSASAIGERVKRHRNALRGGSETRVKRGRNALQVDGCNATEKETEVETEEEGETERTPIPPSGASAFDDAWQLYPRRAGGNPRSAAEKAWRARIKGGAAPAELLDGVRRYRAYCEHEGIVETKFVMQASRFWGPDRHYAEPWSASKNGGGIVARVEALHQEQAEKEQRDAEWLARRARDNERGSVS